MDINLHLELSDITAENIKTQEVKNISVLMLKQQFAKTKSELIEFGNGDLSNLIFDFSDNGHLKYSGYERIASEYGCEWAKIVSICKLQEFEKKSDFLLKEFNEKQTLKAKLKQFGVFQYSNTDGSIQFIPYCEISNLVENKKLTGNDRRGNVVYLKSKDEYILSDKDFNNLLSAYADYLQLIVAK